ncbi:hypothetical protein [Enterococcus alishanensis]
MKDVNQQTEANKKWQEKNREHTRYLRNRSTSRSFIKKQATTEDLEELKSLIVERERVLMDEKRP